MMAIKIARNGIPGDLAFVSADGSSTKATVRGLRAAGYVSIQEVLRKLDKLAEQLKQAGVHREREIGVYLAHDYLKDELALDKGGSGND